MSITILFLGILLLFFSLLFLFFLNNIYKVDLKPVQFKTIDGLRGYLAFFVYLHHIYIYYNLYKNASIPHYLSNVMNQFGDASVVLFFMITGFLFTSKFLNEKELKTDWLKLYISRILRIYPAYILLLCLQLTIIFWLSDFALTQKPILIAKELIIWLSFSIIDYLPINGFNDTQLMTANVLWTIKYEVFFYLCIPMMALLISKIKPSVMLVGFTLICSIYIGYKINIQLIYIFPFLIGILTAYLAQNQQICDLAKKHISSIVILATLIGVMILFNTSYNYFVILLLAICFIGIACGNSIFGILSSNISRLFGQLSYSMYLLHGIILYIVFKLCIGEEHMKELTNLKYGIIIFGCTILLIIISLTSFKFIEKPAISAAKKIVQKIRTVYKKIR